jgi:hypothetical protein
MRDNLSNEMTRSVSAAFVAVFALTGCFGRSEPQSADTHRSSSSTARSQVTAGTCPVTLPNESLPPDATDWPKRDSHGNGKLWTLLWPYGVVLAPPEWVEKDGSIGVKWPWWRGVHGGLKIEGRRLDKTAGPVRVDMSPDYGLSGFQPSGIYFAGEGCWEVTGRVGGASLTFVTLVAKASTYGLELKTG